MEKTIYEYKVMNLYMVQEAPNALGDFLTKLSEEGWNLVCVFENRHYFRREKEESTEKIVM